MEIKKDILWRVYLCYLAIVVCGLAVIGRAAYIQRAEGKFWKNLGDSLHLKYLPVAAERGSIYSEDGNMLSTSIPIFDVYIDFGAEGLREKGGKRFYENLDSLCISLASLYGDKSAGEFNTELRQAFKKKARYYPLRKKISFAEFQAMRDFPLVRQGRNKSGFIIEPRDKRINPYVLLANRTIGLSRNDPSQNVGLERSYDSLLTGTKGQRLVRYVAGAYMPIEGAEVDPVNGKDIVTTLDTYMQDVAESALLKMLTDNNSTHGTVIVMETATGKIKAIANLGKQADGSYAEDLNYGIGKRTEPGSIFKLATLLALLEDKYVDINSIVDCEGGSKSFYGLRIKDSHLGTGAITVKEAFYISSNVAFAKLAEQYYHNQPKKFISHLQRFRLDTITGIDVTASSGKPVIYKPSSKFWHNTTIPYMAHGYGQLVTPLHMLMLYNAVANDGKMMKPYLVNEVREYGVTVKSFEPVVLVNKICSDETLAQARICLKAVVDSTHGTGHRVLYDSNYSISGKTGTAVSALNNKGYNKGNKIYQSSFIGFFPSEKPKYTVAVVIQNSNQSKQYYGATVAGKVFKDVSDQIYSHSGNDKKNIPVLTDSSVYSYKGFTNEFKSVMSYLGIQGLDSVNEGNWSRVQIQKGRAVLRPDANASKKGKKTPDVTGMGLRDALYLLENNGFRTSVSGRGRVVTQSVAPGTAYNKGQRITIYLN